MPSPVLVTIDAPPRGDAVQAFAEFVPAEVVCTWSWGLQPATALIDWVSLSAQPVVVPLASMKIEIGAHTFYGICKSLVPVLSSSGNSMMQEFVDSREFLMWDVVYGAFNIRDPRWSNGRLVRRYRHLLPVNFNSGTWTYTTSPYSAKQILNFCFNAPTVESPWDRFYHNALDNFIYDVDFSSGRKLGLAVQEVSERVGLTFTLQGGRYRLVWALKGVGPIPDFPANSENRRVGTAMSGNPTRVRMLGGRNRYQVLNCVLEPDWKPAWESFYDFHAFVTDIYENEKTEAAFGGIPAGTRYNDISADDDHLVGLQLASARARNITVGQYAAMRDVRSGGSGEAYRDVRKFNNRSRLQMPVALYLASVMFKAFRLPAGFYVRNVNAQNIGLLSLDLADAGLVRVSHDPVTGLMSWDNEAPGAGNGYAIAKGYQVASDAFKTLRPQYFDLDKWKDQQGVWQELPFQVDNSGEGDQFIIFDEAMILSDDLIDQITINSVLQTYPDGRPKTALKVGATVTTPEVRAALTFLGEKFSYVAGTGARDDVENVDLNSDFVTYANHPAPTEIPYGDGETASQKASILSLALLNRQFYYVYGGYTVQGNNGTQLTAVIDRVTVRLSADGGLTEVVDFTNERTRAVSTNVTGAAVLHVEPEREFERRNQLNPLLPGQKELRQEADQQRATAQLLRQNPKIQKTIVETFHLLMGLDTAPEVTLLTGDAEGPLPIGTPLFRGVDSNNPIAPNDATSGTTEKPIFAGVTVVDSEATTGPVRASRHGNGGVVQARVKGPVTFNAVVGVPKDEGDDSLASLKTYLVADPHTSVGNCLEEWEDETIRLVAVKVTGSGGGGEAAPGHIRGEWHPDLIYSLDDIVTKPDVGSFGYVYPTPSSGHDPEDGGPYWIQLAGDGLGRWR